MTEVLEQVNHSLLLYPVGQCLENWTIFGKPLFQSLWHRGHEALESSRPPEIKLVF